MNVINGGAGGDLIFGNGGKDTIDGGADNDTVLYAGNQADYTVTPGAPGAFTVTDNNPLDGDDGTDTLTNVENIVFGADSFTQGVELRDASDNLVATFDSIQQAHDSAQALAGFTIRVIAANYSPITVEQVTVTKELTIETDTNVGVDLEFGGANEAWTQDEPDLIGGVWREIASVDTTENLTGTAFDDTLRGDAANNTLTGGAGDDRLTGRGGNDVFDFNATTFGHDTIIDFTDGLDLLDFTDAGLGVADFTITQQGANTIVNLTADPTQAITLLNFNAAQLDGNDFV